MVLAAARATDGMRSCLSGLDMIRYSCDHFLMVTRLFSMVLCWFSRKPTVSWFLLPQVVPFPERGNHRQRRYRPRRSDLVEDENKTLIWTMPYPWDW